MAELGQVDKKNK